MSHSRLNLVGGRYPVPNAYNQAPVYHREQPQPLLLSAAKPGALRRSPTPVISVAEPESDEVYVSRKGSVHVTRANADTASGYYDNADGPMLRPQIPTAPPPRRPPLYYLLPKERHAWLFRLACAMALLAAANLAVGALCIQLTDYCPYYTPVWAPGFLLLTAIVGLAASRADSQNAFVAHLCLCAAALVTCAAALYFCVALNLATIGTVEHSSWAIGNHCVLYAADRRLLDEVWRRMAPFDFAHCVLRLKLGVAAHAVTVAFTALQALCCVASAFMCCSRTCFCGDQYYDRRN